MPSVIKAPFIFSFLLHGAVFILTGPNAFQYFINNQKNNPYQITVYSNDVTVAKVTPQKVKKTSSTIATSTDVSGSEPALSILPVPHDGMLVTEGVKPVNMNEINKTIRRTDIAVKEKIEGKIKLKLLIDELGHVRQVTPLNELGFGLDEVAITAAWKLLFIPAHINNKKVALETLYTVKFKTEFH